jgi:hypothetical protein
MESVLAGETTPALSATITLKEYVPAELGVPLTVPLVEFSPSPGGNAPVLTAQLPYGDVPPVTLSVCEYVTPTVPLGNEEVVIVGDVGFTLLIETEQGFELTPPTVMLSDRCPLARLDGIRMFACPTPTRPGTKPIKLIVAGCPSSWALDGSIGRDKGDDGAGTPLGTGLSTCPMPVRYAVTTEPTTAGLFGVFKL